MREYDQAVGIDIRDGMVWVVLKDRRVIGMPLDFFPWLEQASPEQRANYRLYPFTIYWPDLEDGIDVEALITGDWTATLADQGAAT
jgi:hypothetical protein